jgi:hypothetical protein
MQQLEAELLARSGNVAPKPPEEPPVAAMPKKMFAKETKLASEGHASTRDVDDRALRYLRILQTGANGTAGILAVHDADGEELIPYAHQRQAVKKAADASTDFILLAHDAGTGKTATFFQLFAAIELLVRGGARAIVTVPSATLGQWEDTARTWLSLKAPDATIVVTNKFKAITEQMLRRVRVLIISRHLLFALHDTNFFDPSQQRGPDGKRLPSSGHKKGVFLRRPGVPLHPFWHQKWDLLGIDEAHFMRNPDSGWCVSHNALSMGVKDGDVRIGGCRKRVALTATPVFNRPLDMVGLCKAIGSTSDFQVPRYWSLDKASSTINPHAVTAFQKHTDRVKDDILQLPPIKQKVVRFDALMAPEDAAKYNALLHEAKQLRMKVDGKTGKLKKGDLTQLMMLLSRMQQQIVSPLLAAEGAKQFSGSAEKLTAAASLTTGSLLALRKEIVALQALGHDRVIVACVQVEMMRIARAFLNNGDENVGSIHIYDGTLSLPQRASLRQAFMSDRKSVLFLSIGAGGTGLHLVPSRPDRRTQEEFCRAMIFWGSRPFSPQQVWQSLKRIHRIGQRFEVHVRHLISHGSVDDAIDKVHADKLSLASAITDDDWTRCDLTGQWRQSGRIVDLCTPLLPSGNFPVSAIAGAARAAGPRNAAEAQAAGASTKSMETIHREEAKARTKAASSSVSAVTPSMLAQFFRTDGVLGKSRVLPLPRKQPAFKKQRLGAR